jgi:hypothetical protein
LGFGTYECQSVCLDEKVTQKVKPEYMGRNISIMLIIPADIKK